ncbi:MAG: hypothetical protein JWM68_234 [Verrucomicrobiales bacterium]|nr:hypothetical protein [Verrucomicrobiales bacterium]
MKLVVTSNAPKYRDSIVEYMAAFKVGRKQALRTEGGKLGEKLIAFTPPRNKAQGRSRVAKDIRKLFFGVDDMAEFDKVGEAIRNNNIQTVGGEPVVRLFSKKDGTVYGVDRRLYRPDATLEYMSQFHQNKRNGRGRVGEAGQSTRDIGRWKFLDVMAVPADRLKEYIKSVQDRVGRGKGGWAAGTIKLGGRVAQWIAIHARTAGRFEDHLDDGGDYMLFENRSEWASGGDDDRVMENAISARTRDILRAVKRELDKGVFRP